MEDTIYLASSQHKLWSFTPESLSSVRKATNAAAAAQVREAIMRAREKKMMNGGVVKSGNSNGMVDSDIGTPADGSGNGNGVGADGLALGPDEKEIECLTAEEELKLVRYYCRKIMDIATVFEFPTNIKATAPTFLRRFFTRTSPMTYHPKTLLTTILYLTTKTENHYIHLKDFSSKIPKSSPEEILAPEFVVAMGLRWCFEVKHPFRGLEGAIMELVKVSEGKYIHPTHPTTSDPQETNTFNPPTPAEWQAKLHNLPPLPTSPHLPPKPRIERAHGKARSILSGPVLLTDAYFLFTPPQIYLSSIYLVDPPLAHFFLDLKHPYPHQSSLLQTLKSIIESCAEEVRKGGEPGAQISKEEMDEVKRIDRKLYFCRNPEKVDLVGVSKQAKRGVTEDEESGTGGNGEAERREREVKKRKLEREKSFREGEELFGSQTK
ncbi:cyclin-like protein [Terfezia boudieri ATCC MYA-4762]|uniref:Cyclin-like protein n=1 Tax=Terfezia boudieri ATCC MYA-4762 TaxID=1051890 RepID=A0A3N4LDJ2_9PEZI|nr:cyclin-like protein [Terfezia boudieri ATCC MYA-4762]